jgi:hypothetical protein
VALVRRYDTAREAVQAVRCFGWAFVYRDKGQFVVSEVALSYRDFLGIFTADYAARHGKWKLAELILGSME